MSGSSDRRGFSLIELAVVVVVIGLMLALTMPALQRQLTTHNLRNSGQIVAGELKLARQKAVTNGQTNWVWFSASYNGYWTRQENEAWKGPYFLPARVTVENPNFNGWNYTWFTPDGRAARAGAVVLVNTATQRDTVNLDLSGSVWR